MHRTLEDYRDIVGDKVIGEIQEKAKELRSKHIMHVNSTHWGGGVAEILSSLIPLLNDAGVSTGWRILHGAPDFFTITKKFHNALQGQKINFTDIKKRVYKGTNEVFSTYTHIDHDCVVIHDPQPLPLIKFYEKKQPWIWRCHIDLSNPQSDVFEYLEQFILLYDIVVLSNERYRMAGLSVEQRVIYPSIDPLSLKNRDLEEKDIQKYTGKFGIPQDKPIMLYVSRFDRWKDPIGVLEVFKVVRESVDCRLIYCYDLAIDDPEGFGVYSKMAKECAEFLSRKEVMFIRGNNQILVNVLQRVASVVIQKSLREGFGLVVTEAMWKGKPVVASNIGGIPLQIRNGRNGYLCEPLDVEGFAERIVRLLKDKELADRLGEAARETVRKKFLITRHLLDYLSLFKDLVG